MELRLEKGRTCAENSEKVVRFIRERVRGRGNGMRNRIVIIFFYKD